MTDALATPQIYVAHLFRKGNLKKLWPVRILRFLVAGTPIVGGRFQQPVAENREREREKQQAG